MGDDPVLANLPLTPKAECGIAESPSFIPTVELSRSRKYCIDGGKEGCTRKTYWVFRYLELGPFSVVRKCWKHMSDVDRAVFRAEF